jgi:hypothetical protein
MFSAMVPKNRKAPAAPGRCCCGSRTRTAAHVHAVELDGALGDVVEAADQVDQGALARAAVADQADHLAGLDVQVQMRMTARLP